MDYVTRLVSGTPSYPLPVHGSLDWEGDAAGRVCTEFRLPATPAGHIIVPSFAAPACRARYRFELVTSSASYALQSVPVRDRLTDRATPHKGAAPVSCHIDCWHTHAPIDASTVRLVVDAPCAPGTALATVSARPMALEAPAPAAMNVSAGTPAAISQMQASNSLRQRICSPTALAMALSVAGPRPSWPEAVAACYDRGTGAYGSWPLAIRLAACHGRAGAVEVLPDWSSVPAILELGLPMVVSVDYGAGQLSGAAIPQTAGHLVTLHSVRGDKAYVYDPAAPTHAEVPRAYDLEEFSRAWLQRRGAAYIFPR